MPLHAWISLCFMHKLMCELHEMEMIFPTNESFHLRYLTTPVFKGFGCQPSPTHIINPVAPITLLFLNSDSFKLTVQSPLK